MSLAKTLSQLRRAQLAAQAAVLAAHGGEGAVRAAATLAVVTALEAFEGKLDAVQAAQEAHARALLLGQRKQAAAALREVQGAIHAAQQGLRGVFDLVGRFPGPGAT